MFSESLDALVIHTSYQISFLKPAKVFFLIIIFSTADRECMPLAGLRNIISKMKKPKATKNLCSFF